MDRMTEHSKVASFEPIASDLEYIYTIHRRDGLLDVRVHLTDAYEYGYLEYVARPNELRRNSFVVLGLPHAHSVSDSLIEQAKFDGIGLGTIAKFMGALNRQNVWEYESPQERADREARERDRKHDQH
jgi:hypothetical protein